LCYAPKINHDHCDSSEIVASNTRWNGCSGRRSAAPPCAVDPAKKRAVPCAGPMCSDAKRTGAQYMYFFRLAACSCLPWLSFVALRGAPRGTAGMTSFRSHFCAAPVKKLLKQASGTQAKPRSVERVQRGDQETSSTSRTAQWPPSALPRPFWRLQDAFVSLRHFAVPLNLNTSPDAFDRTASKLRTANTQANPRSNPALESRAGTLRVARGPYYYT